MSLSTSSNSPIRPRAYSDEALRQHQHYVEVRERLWKSGISHEERQTPPFEPQYRGITYLRRNRLIGSVLVGAPSREKKTIVPVKIKSYALRAALRATGRDIVIDTALAYGLTYDDLIGPSRLKEVSVARQEAMYRIRHELRLSFKDVARVLRRDDHTTTRWGCMAHAKRIAAIKARIEAAI